MRPALSKHDFIDLLINPHAQYEERSLAPPAYSGAKGLSSNPSARDYLPKGNLDHVTMLTQQH